MESRNQSHHLEDSMPKNTNQTLDADQPILKIENITVARPPLLKIFYWESLAIDKLNEKLCSNENRLEHHLELPPRQLNSNPLVIVFWLRNLSDFEYVMRLKRLQNCRCVPKETKVGFNQYRNLYHCPHRRLINISQDCFVMKPNELLAMTLMSFYYILGQYTLTFELSVAERRVILLNFHTNITGFDVEKSVLTTKMIPVNMREHRVLSQALWVQNITKQNIRLSFASRDCDMNLINPKMTIPPQSVWPLIVQYRPRDFENEIKLIVRCGERDAANGPVVKYKIPITCKGFIEEEEDEKYCVPVSDYECTAFLYVIYPNRLEFITEINEERTLMVAVHNYDQKCIECKWQTYALNDFFSFTFEPTKFSLKPHHFKLCVVRVKTFKNPLHFKRIPAILEVHRLQDKSTQIAKQLLTEIESIDDPKWSESSYMGHVYLHLDLKVKYPKIQTINVEGLLEESHSVKSDGCKASCQTTIFEKLFWDYLSKSNYMRNTSKVSRNLPYSQVLNNERSTKNADSSKVMGKQEALNILSCLTAEACRYLAKNYRFVPQELLESI